MPSIPFLNSFRRKSSEKQAKPAAEKPDCPDSVLNLPFDQYDPITGLPATIQIGEEKVVPMVAVSEMRDHLVFLRALYNFRVSSPPTYPARCLSSAKAYAHWAQHVLPTRESPRTPLRKDELPSVGVLACWHSHMLNPTVYDVDVQGAYGALEGWSFPLELVRKAFEEDVLPPDDSEENTAASEHATAEIKTTRWSPQDIADAVQRQAKFVDNMHNIGWLKEDRWIYGTSDLQIGIVLYHAWLDLMHATKVQQFLVPRLDIDLAWHSHQLHGPGYKADTERLLGKFLDHNDAAGDGKLGDGLKTTGELWKKRYGWNYQ
ncbi:hypothetical protein IAT38_006782 [Cryptococcus sp. DSM 104549]